MSRRLPNLRHRLPRALLLTTVSLLTCAGVAQADTTATEPSCKKGEFCTWSDESYGGTAQRFDLRTANPEECIPLPANFEGHSFINRMTRDVTVYQSLECTTEGDFITYPGGGTYVPQAPFVVRALKIWD
ncbi:peptidase inhibitor family I36 protein [Amycolatopsis sp. H20-H5]|uniref:peptidase inhibitor family I36 protein n=1 Tax=Amycolatopsis sp. H20-H5 TaxID=3046309 RepID=UPI002DBA9A52|nr:peptidase inhibitor family I36 protein [Amycolatopsis sp. H20-H5]MEC3978426.1 peptidase inhibitor family I36 protein [Amycolatopsis sp. H20-H5]